MNRYPITTKIAFILDIAIILILVISWTRPYTFPILNLAQLLAFVIPLLGAVGLILSIVGLKKKRTKFGIVLIILNVFYIFSYFIITFIMLLIHYSTFSIW